jgi:hypothetical protein
MSTVGTEEDFRYFVPRLLELVVTGEFRQYDVEIAFGKIERSGWDDWPSYRRDVAATLLEVFWSATLAEYPRPYPAEEVLCGLSRLVAVEPLLDRWLETDGAATRHLADFTERNLALARSKKRLANSFWPPEAHQVVIDWLLGDTS